MSLGKCSGCILGLGTSSKCFPCPYCNQLLDVIEWDTEYGDPLCGDHS